jgi:ribosomal protein S18 acetylase RimI-like enzyme
MITRAMREDREALLAIATDVGIFTPTEIACIDELLQAYLTQPDHGGYDFLVYRNGEGALGFACYGSHPLTQGTFDLYWLCTARKAQGQGIGGALLRRVEEEVQTQGGRLLLAETSSTPAYALARRFYESHGFRCESVVHDFYSPSDDLLIYVRRLDGAMVLCCGESAPCGPRDLPPGD